MSIFVTEFPKPSDGNITEAEKDSFSEIINAAKTPVWAFSKNKPPIIVCPETGKPS